MYIKCIRYPKQNFFIYCICYCGICSASGLYCGRKDILNRQKISYIQPTYLPEKVKKITRTLLRILSIRIKVRNSVFKKYPLSVPDGRTSTKFSNGIIVRELGQELENIAGASLDAGQAHTST